MQDQVLPKTDREDSRIGLPVVVCKGHLKGYKGLIKDIRHMVVDVELEALITGASNPIQSFRWDQLE